MLAVQAFLIKSHGGTPQYWWFHELMQELRHSVIIQMNESMSTFYHKWLDLDTKKELFEYLIMDTIRKHRNTWDTDLVKLCHLTDPE